MVLQRLKTVNKSILFFIGRPSLRLSINLRMRKK